MMASRTRTLPLVIAAFAGLATGCNVFDEKLYMQKPAHDLGAADLAMSSALDAAPMPDPTLCDRKSSSTLCPGSYLFCDGFENESGSNFSAWTSLIVSNDGNGGPANPGTIIEVANASVCLGQKAMHAHSIGAHQQAFLFRSFSNRANPLHVRFYFYISQVSLPFEILGYHAPSGEYATLYVDPTAATFNFATSFSSAASAFPAGNLPTNRWMCLEVAIRFNPTGEVQVLLDDKQLGDVKGINTQPNGVTLDTVNVGIISTDANDTGENDVYVDEVAMSMSSIGCM